MKKILYAVILTALIVTLSYPVSAQGVGIGTNTPNPSARLDIQSTNSGILIPRLTTVQRKGIANPEMGLMVFDTDRKTFLFYDGQQWKGLEFSSGNYSQPIERNPSDPVKDKWFGSSVAITERFAAIGAIREDVGTSVNAGAVYIFEKSANGNWIQQARITAPDADTNDHFGHSVDIKGDYLVVGAPRKSLGATWFVGQAYIYKFDGSNWKLEATLVKPNAEKMDEFGADVAIDDVSGGGPVAVIGSVRGDAGNNVNLSRGVAYVYRRNANTNSWFSQASLSPADGANLDYFGYSVDIDGDYLVVGSPEHDHAGLYDRGGAAYVYVYGGGVWTLQKKLMVEAANYKLGYSVSIYGDLVAIGAPAYNNYTGRVFVSRRTGADWGNLSIVILPPSTITGDRLFGAEVSISGSHLLVGAPAYDIENEGGSEPGFTKNNGVAYLYELKAGENSLKYILKQQFEDPYPITPNLYGQAVAIGDHYYIVSHHLFPTGGMTECGTVYFGALDQ